MPGPTESIATERLELTPLRVADAEEMVGVLEDPALYGFVGGEPPTRSDLVARFRAQVIGRSPDGRETWLNWIVRERPSGAATGFVQATLSGPDEDPAPSAEVAWLIGTRWQGRGYATEAVRGLVAWLEANGIQSIVAHIHPDHAASAAVAERAGLEPTDRVLDGERAWQRIAPPGRRTGRPENGGDGDAEPYPTG